MKIFGYMPVRLLIGLIKRPFDKYISRYLHGDFHKTGFIYDKKMFKIVSWIEFKLRKLNNWVKI